MEKEEGKKWSVIVRSPRGEPSEYDLKIGKNILGRKSDSDIVLPDISASRQHAEIFFKEEENVVVIRDLDSTNGTFVNRERITDQCDLKPNDLIRIGVHVINIQYQSADVKSIKRRSTTRYFTRDLVLESLDQHAVFMYEVSTQLNTVLDIDTALNEVANLMRRTMGASRCEVILAEDFDKLKDMGFPTSIAKVVAEDHAAIVIPDMTAETDLDVGDSAVSMGITSALCVPIMSGEEIFGMIYMYKTNPEARPFDHRDLQLAVAISHQAAMTIQRMRLISRVQREQKIRQLLQRFLSPPEAEFLMQGYLRSGHLPELAERRITILFADIADSTGLAERLGPRRFGEILSRYYQDMTEIVFDHGGLLDKYLGDGVMAIFGMTESHPDPEGRAVRAGLSMLDRVDTMNREYGKGERISIGVGINTGPVMVGYVGTDERVELTAIGDTVNVASHLQIHARPNRVLVAPATCAAIAGRFSFQRIGQVEIKGRKEQIQVYEILL